MICINHTEKGYSLTAQVSVLVFIGLTAFDTQKLKELYAQGADSEAETKTAIMGALTLHLDFINIFLNLLRLIGNRRER